MDPTQIPGLSGWPSLVITLLTLFFYGLYSNKSVKAKLEKDREKTAKEAEDIAKKATQDAIEAMQTHINILRERMSETEKANAQMRHTIETIYSALKARGIYIMIDGDSVHIRDNGNSTTILMKKEE